jgi:hypothetical protein
VRWVSVRMIVNLPIDAYGTRLRCDIARLIDSGKFAKAQSVANRGLWRQVE